MIGHKDQVTRNGSSVEALRVYRICLFERGAIVPAVHLVSAACDEQAVALAQAINPSAEREIWDMHRLVAHWPAVLEDTSQLGERVTTAAGQG